MNFFRPAFLDILSGFRQSDLFLMLGWQDVLQRYRRSFLGPLWLTFSMFLTILVIGIVFSVILKSSLVETLPFISISLIIWNFINSIISEGCYSFINSTSMIRQLSIPFFIFVLRVVWRNLIIFGHNLLIIPVFFLIFNQKLSLISFLVIPGFILLTLNLCWISLLLGILSSRYRDIPQIVSNLMQIMYYITPIMWMPKLFESSLFGKYALNLNPFFHLLQIIRLPFFNEMPALINWLFPIFFAFFGWIFTLFVFGRYKNRIAYWV